MSLTINSTRIADARIQSVSLRPVLGAYDLVFGLILTVRSDKQRPGRASISGASVTIKTRNNEQHTVDFARPEAPLIFAARSNESRQSSALFLRLYPGQLTAMETLRGTGDIDFELLFVGIGDDGYGDQPMQDNIRIHVPRSDWLKRLRDAGARDILLLEVPLPIRKRAKPWAAIAKDLKRAEENFRNGDYHACVGSCRTSIQELGHHKFNKKKDWSRPLLDRLANGRSNMTKQEREAELWGTLRHYTHQAHHGDSEGGEADYSRTEAQLILILTASFVAHARAG